MVNIDKEKVFKKITEIASSIVSEDSEKITRADLADELKKEGFKCDSEEVAKIVYECYEKTSDESVRDAFLNNSRTRTLIEDATALSLVSDDGGKKNADGKSENDEKLFDFFDENFNSSKMNLETLATAVSQSMQTVATEAAKLVNVISGTSALQSIQNEAGQIFAKYTKITDSYKNAKDSINALTSDFTSVRNSICDTYRKRAAELIDIFGERIKVTMPELFDFDKIEWLDIESMKKSVELEYTNFSSKCGELIGGASANFKNAIGELALLKNDKQAALVLASWNLVSHYLDVANSTALLRSKSMQLKTAVTKDIAIIKSDQMRLLEIFKTLNDILIPKAKIFRKASGEIFDSEFENLVASVYSTPEAKELKEKRDSILDELHYLENAISDAQENINFYESHIKECSTTLENIRGDYERAKSSKPEKPNILQNVFSFGSAKKEYDRDVSDWSKKCSAVIKTFEELTVDIEIESKDLLEQKKNFAENKRRYETLKREQNEISAKLLKCVSASKELKSKVAEKLESIVKLLRIAKDIASSKLEERLMQVQLPKDYVHFSIGDMELPKEIRTSLEKFKSDYIPLVKDGFKESVREEVNAEINSLYTKEEVGDEARDAISEKISEEILTKSVSLCKIFNQIEKDGEKYAGTKEHYEKELRRIQSEFKENIRKLDKKADALAEIIRRINTSGNGDELKDSLRNLLGTEEKPITKEELGEFLDGSRILEI